MSSDALATNDAHGGSHMDGQNLLIIMSDQHSRGVLGCYGHPVVLTPNLDRLAARGTRFTACWTPSLVCIPARAELAPSSSRRRPSRSRHRQASLPIGR